MDRNSAVALGNSMVFSVAVCPCPLPTVLKTAVVRQASSSSIPRNQSSAIQCGVPCISFLMKAAHNITTSGVPKATENLLVRISTIITRFPFSERE